MPEFSLEDYLKENPAVTDLSDYEKVKSMMNSFFSKYKEISRTGPSINSDLFTCLIAGPLFTIPGEGMEPYNNIPNMISFLFALYKDLSKLKDNDDDEKEDIKNKIDFLVSTCTESNAIYDSVMNAMEVHKTELSADLMIDILSKVGPSSASHADMKVFSDCVNITSFGQLLNNNLSKKYRTELVYVEISKGLRSDKISGIPSSEIVEFFVSAKDSLIINSFDISTLVINLYITLYNIRNMNDYIATQTKNIEYQYFSDKKNKGVDEQTIKEKAFAKTSSYLSEHYYNVQRIFDSLITRINISGINAIEPYTFAYILAHVPPSSYFARSSYDKVMKEFDNLSKLYNSPSDECDPVREYLNIIRYIIFTCPNVNLPLDIYHKINGEENIDWVIDGIKLGFARYAYYITDQVGQLVSNHFGVGFQNIGGKVEEGSYSEASRYLNLDFIGKLRFILEDIPEAVKQTEIECVKAAEDEQRGRSDEGEGAHETEEEEEDPSGESPELFISKSRAYIEGGLNKALQSANSYIKSLFQLKEEYVCNIGHGAV
jgi:hypothetical protein